MLIRIVIYFGIVEINLVKDPLENCCCFDFCLKKNNFKPIRNSIPTKK